MDYLNKNQNSLQHVFDVSNIARSGENHHRLTSTITVYDSPQTQMHQRRLLSACQNAPGSD